MGTIGRKPADAVLTSDDINDGTITPSDLSTGHPTWDSTGRLLSGTTTALGAEAGSVTISTGDSGITTTDAIADDLVVENDAAAGISILTPNTSTAQIYFGDPQDNNIGRIQYDHNGDYMRFYTNGSERMRIDSSGHLIVPNGVTLGTAVGTYNAANTLDDYEEGTWTIEYHTNGTDFSSITYDSTYRIGSYVKIGGTVVASGRLRTQALTVGSATGAVYFSLPFVASDNGSVDISWRTGFASGKHPYGAYINNGSAAAYMVTISTVGGNTTTASPSNMGTGANANDIFFMAVYTTAA